MPFPHQFWEELKKKEPRISEIPFDSEYKFMATLHKSNQDRVIYAKGAPEKILDLSSFINIEGKKIALSEFKGKFVMLNFWATW